MAFVLKPNIISTSSKSLCHIPKLPYIPTELLTCTIQLKYEISRSSLRWITPIASLTTSLVIWVCFYIPTFTSGICRRPEQ